jgi:hypothetical protein
MISGGIPFFTGLAMKQNTLAVVGGLVSAGAGALAGCCAGIPVAILFTMVIVLVAQTSARARLMPPPGTDDTFNYDDYGRAFKHGREARHDRTNPASRDRGRESEDDWRRRAEVDERARHRGFRPRPRDPDPDA